MEQKNWTHIRPLLGYGRLEAPALVEQINQLHREVWEPLNNFFQPSSKLLTKTREGAKVRRQHATPRTRCDRLLDEPTTPERVKRPLGKSRRLMDRFGLKDQLEQRLDKILRHAHPARRPPGFLPDGAKTTTVNNNPPVS